ncbi:hypothetical protein PG999_005447 [Apiospora kogelbergensis]|uniref:Uncharacterized protein n=1 Tax=Apiospora kogelbergensis TaxID=1337665 RepID=A0AAW0R245_9PEZI
MVSRLDIQLDQLEGEAKKYQPCTGEVIVSIHLPGPQAEIIEIQLRTVTVTEVRKEQFTVCRSSSSASISNAPNYVELFCKQLPLGEWINGGHTTKPAPETLLPTHEQDNFPNQSSRYRKRRTNQPSSPTDSQIPVSKTVQTFLNKVQTGLKRLASPKKGLNVSEATNDDILQLLPTTSTKRRDLESIIAELKRIKEAKSASAARDDWRLEHLIRCIRMICRARHQLSVSDDPQGNQKRQETAASKINKVVNCLIPQAGPLALVVYSALAETKYKWDGARMVGDVEDVVAGIRRKAIEVPEQLELFNPVLALSWILQEDYQSICKELDLVNFTALCVEGADGIFKGLPLGFAMAHACLPNKAIQVPEKSTWLLEAIDDAFQYGNPRKRQRQAAVVDDPCTRSDLHQGCAPTDDGSSADLGLRSNSFDDMLWENPGNGEYHPCELCDIAMSSLGCSCNMPLSTGGAGVLFSEEGLSMTNEEDSIQLLSYPELPFWLTDPAANMNSVILHLDSQCTINPALIQQF